MANAKWTQADLMRQHAKFAKRVKTDTALEPTTLAPKPSKYRNVKTVIQGEKFDSKREADYWLFLKAREQAGEITDLKRQVRFPLYAPDLGQDPLGEFGWTGVLLQVAEYVADMTYIDLADKLMHVIDAKARRISPYPLKAKWLELQDGIVIEEV